jgi:lipid-A-disaccharide synthase
LINAPARRNPHLFLVAGEPSGDALGAPLIAALRELTGGGAGFAGVGGPLMAAQGFSSLFPFDDLAVMGLTEVVPRIPLILRRLGETADAVRRERPDVLVTIDSPGFSFRLAKRLVGQGVPLVHYVAPSVWAWRPGRARKIGAFLDHLLALFPFEPPYFEAVGLPCTFVGHPVVEKAKRLGDGEVFRRCHGIPGDAPLLCVLPGSRHSELEPLLPIFREVVVRLAASRPALRLVVPTVAAVADRVSAEVQTWPGQPLAIRDEGEKWHAFAAATAALAASGTVALELGLAGLASVIAYKVSPLTAWLIRRTVRVRYANLVNILLDDEVVPECLQENCTPERLTAHVARLLDDAAARREQTTKAHTALARLGLGGPPPSRRAAEAILDVIGYEVRTQAY